MNSSPEESAFCPSLVRGLVLGPCLDFSLAFVSTGLLRKSPILLRARAVLARVDLSLVLWLGGALLLLAREGPATGAGG